METQRPSRRALRSTGMPCSLAKASARSLRSRIRVNRWARPIRLSRSTNGPSSHAVASRFRVLSERGFARKLPGMDNDIISEAFRRGVDPVFDLLTPEQAEKIAEYHADEALQRRIEWLAGRANEGALSDEESAEYQGYARANQFLSVLCAGVRRKLAS